MIQTQRCKSSRNTRAYSIIWIYIDVDCSAGSAYRMLEMRAYLRESMVDGLAAGGILVKRKCGPGKTS